MLLSPLGIKQRASILFDESNKREECMAHKVLVIDVGGTHVKILATGQKAERKVDSGKKMTAQRMCTWVKPFNLGKGWVAFDYSKALGCPVKIVNDAAMQAIGSYQGGRMLFLGLGTGLGSAMIVNGVVEPMELAHLPYKNGKSYEDYLGLRGLERMGRKKWCHYVTRIVEELRGALNADYVVLGGGNSAKVKNLPPKTRLGKNENAFRGGFRLWSADKDKRNRINAD
jgi:predicted NBD/HSP70 family sugar kinase